MIEVKKRTIYQRLSRSVHAVPGSGVVYVENPKVACSNVKWSLVQAYSEISPKEINNVHDRRQTPFENSLEGILGALTERENDFFTIVRHPRKRFVSAYFDKMFHGRDESVWVQLAEQLDLAPDEVYPPKVILKRMLASPRQDLDPHAALQTVNLFWGSIPYTRVLYLEKMPRSGFFSTGNNRVFLSDRQSHSVKNRVDMSLFDGEAFDLIDEYYSDDYTKLGYSKDLETPSVDEVQLTNSRSVMVDFLSTRAPIKFLKSFFSNGPRGLNVNEMTAVNDRLTLDQRWPECSHRLLDFIIVRNFVHNPEIMARYTSDSPFTPLP